MSMAFVSASVLPSLVKVSPSVYNHPDRRADWPGVDHLFKSVNILLVGHQEAISRGQTLRRQGSIFLHEDDKTPDVQASGYCCT